MIVKPTLKGHSHDPDIFGPAFWFTLHNGSTSYSSNPNWLMKESMKQLLNNLYIIIPCISCREHFYHFIKNVNLDDVVMNRDSLFKFLVDVHNYVNNRYNKRIFSLEEAKYLYGFDNPNGALITITFK